MIDSFNKVILFSKRIIESLEEVWHDEHGSYRIVIGSDILDQELVKLHVRRILTANYLQEKVPYIRQSVVGENLEDIVSIGSFGVHNEAKILSQQSGCRLITVPVPLANDAFCTNRYNFAEEPSRLCLFPYQTIVDTAILKNIPSTTNLLGLGEFVGLYCSILDYSESHRNYPPLDLLFYIAVLFNDICCMYYADYDVFLQKLAIALSIKCLVMRVNKDYRIGCGIDHLFAHVLEKKWQFPHGKAVYWGSIFSIALYPEWSNFGLDLKILIRNGVKTAIITPETDIRIIDIAPKYLVEAAMKTRADRPTVLSTVESYRINNLEVVLSNLSQH